MSVKTSHLDRYVRQAIEAESATAKHDLGFRVTDTASGKRYRYVRVAGNATAGEGWPVGMYLASDDPNIVCVDEADYDAAQPCGQVLLAVTDKYYCWMEERNPGIVTTIRTGTASTIGEGLVWTADGYLTPVAMSTITTDDKHACALVLGTSNAKDLTLIQWM